MDMRKKFAACFDSDTANLRLYHAPGRVNLIGEHTDYNGGYVFPCALSFGTYAAVVLRNDSFMRFTSTGFDAQITVDANAVLQNKAENGWANYPIGIVEEFRSRGFSGRGFDVLYHGNVPSGSGLSSSASIELVTSVLLNDLYDAGLSMIELVKLSQHAENHFVGMNCGIMDQFASGMGKKGRAILLNCMTLDYSYVPLDIAGCKLVITNTNKEHKLTETKYNERRAESELAVQMLQKQLDIRFLCELDPQTFEANKHLITDSTALKRARHAVYENARTLEAVEKLTAGDLRGFGKLMNDSHESLKSFYEVTGPELDALAESAQKLPFVLGSRMTGGGFAGCTVSLVEESGVDAFIGAVGEEYTAATGLTPTFYIAETGDGAGRAEE